MTDLTNKNIISELKQIFDGVGKVATRSGFCELKLSKPQRLDVGFYDNKLTFSSVNISVSESLSEVNAVRFSLPELVSVLGLLQKREALDLSYIKEHDVFWFNGLPLFNTKVLEDDQIFIPETAVTYNRENWSNTIDVISGSKKELKKGFSPETEFLFVDVQNGEIRRLDNFDVKVTKVFDGDPSGDKFLVDKINAKIIESIFSDCDNLDVSFNKNSVLFKSDDIQLKLDRPENLNIELYKPV